MKIRTLFLAAATAALFAACSVDENLNTPQQAVSGVEVTPSSLSLMEGASATLSGRILKWNATAGRSLTWSSKNEEVATVSSEGLVRAVSAGETDIVAECGGQSASVHVTVSPNIWMTRLDALEKPVSFKEFDNATDTIRVARGETATAQFIVHAATSQGTLTPSVKKFALKGSDGVSITPQLWWVREVYVPEYSWDRWAGGAPSFRYPSSEKYIPDALMPLEDWSVSLSAGEKTAFWVEFDIPRDAPAGIYEGIAAVNGTSSAELPFTVQVYDVTLPEKQTLSVMHWVNPNIAAMNVEVEMYSVLDCFEKVIVPFVSKYGTNCFNSQYYHRYTSNPRLVKNSTTGDYEIEADFSELGKEIEMYYRACPDLHYVQCENITSSRASMQVIGYALNDDGTLKVTDNGDGTYTPEYAYISHFDTDTETCIGYSKEAEAFWTRYFAALQKYLESNTLPDGRKYIDVYLQTLYDEPQDKHAAAYDCLAAYVKKGAPKIKVMDPLNTLNVKGESLDVPCPGIMYLKGEEGYPWTSSQTRWIYHAMAPQGEGMNRFIRIPLIQTRLVHWLNFRYNATGFLHWGLNYWHGARNEDEPWLDASGSYPDGDMWIIWPGDNKVYPSIRLCAMRDGIRDYELFRLAEQKSPSEAQALCRSVASDAYTYTQDISYFRTQRKALLELLEGK